MGQRLNTGTGRADWSRSASAGAIMNLRAIIRPALVAVSLVALAGPASASYEPTGTVSVSNPAPAPGGALTVTGSGYAPLSQVTITIGAAQTVLSTVMTTADGSFSTSVTIPATLTGTQTLTATGLNPVGSTRVLAATLNVGGTPLPATGSDTTVLLVAGAVVVAVGAGLVVTSRRRTSVG
jgi:LPXTG-motif cell wall-anchored protein